MTNKFLYNEEEELLDHIKMAKKKKLSILNKPKISKQEIDEIFTTDV